jgi:polysaccharide biosynthesis transport protein
MSQDIQPLNNMAGGGDYWMQGQNAMSAPAQATAPKMSPLTRIHRLLRGRYPLALFAAVCCGLGGAAAGWVLLTPKFESDALIQANPTVITPNVNDPVVPMYSMWMQSQASLIESTGVAEEAVGSKEFKDAWNTAYPHSSLPDPMDFIANVDAEHIKNGFIIQVKYVDKNKQVAQAGARATIDAYMHLHGNGNDAERSRKLDFLNDSLVKQQSDLIFAHKTLDQLSQKYGTSDLTVMNQSVQEELARLEMELSQAKIAYDSAVEATQSTPAGKPADKEFIYQQIASVDPYMRALLEAREQASMNLEDTAKTYGPNHIQYQRSQEGVDHTRRKVEDYAHDFMLRNQGRIPLAFDDQSNAASLKMLQSRVDSLQKQVVAETAKASEIGTLRSQMESLRDEITQYEAAKKGTNDRIEALTAEQKLAQNVIVVDHGSEAVIASDKRKLGAAVGFVFGGLLPVGLMMLYGMIDHRVRYSDETGDSADLAGVTLLGILPNLPDRLSDPQQAGIAAHCVHQIRTMLQINRNSDEPQVLAITSAAAGDGKTSLTLALGLSYAACGARTLLIDCDLVASGLSHRLNVNAPEGVLEAVANRVLLEFVRTTDIADVAILPVGTTHSHHASTLSPVALRRLLSEAKKHFDIILVDTGPILGSIEASLVCAAADRTILTVARGQQRILVERSIGHLQAIGADVAGVVFNRAQARDFEKSLSGLALRTRSVNGNGGSNAAAAEGSFKRAG